MVARLKDLKVASDDMSTFFDRRKLFYVASDHSILNSVRIRQRLMKRSALLHTVVVSGPYFMATDLRRLTHI